MSNSNYQSNAFDLLIIMLMKGSNPFLRGMVMYREIVTYLVPAILAILVSFFVVQSAKKIRNTGVSMFCGLLGTIVAAAVVSAIFGVVLDITKPHWLVPIRNPDVIPWWGALGFVGAIAGGIVGVVVVFQLFLRRTH
jgi:hypothetical protein